MAKGREGGDLGKSVGREEEGMSQTLNPPSGDALDRLSVGVAGTCGNAQGEGVCTRRAITLSHGVVIE